MSRLFVNQIKENLVISETYRLLDKALRVNKHGAYYLQFNLNDRTGSVTGLLWNVTEEFAQKFSEGDYVKCDGTSQLFQGKLQIAVRKLTKVDPNAVDIADFADTSEVDVNAMTSRLREILAGVQDPRLVTLVEAFLADETLMTRLQRSFAGVRLHHAFAGGLLDHTLSIMEMALVVGERYSHIVDRDLLVVGSFLHDIGKTLELSDDPVVPTYTDEGQALGHLYLGAELVDRKIAEIERSSGVAFDPLLAVKLKHMILSHHGTVEFGAVKTPMTREAMALHVLDLLDAKLNEFQRCIQEDSNGDRSWTNYNSALDRKLLK